MRIKQSAKALSVIEYQHLMNRGAAIEYLIDCLLREIPDAETIIIRVEKWVADDSEDA